MKKKFFSKLLMGALLVATVSSYVSCKDYDDDIANLQSQIDKKATLEQIESLKSELASTKSTAEAAQAQAQANLQALAGKADQKALDDAIAAVRKEAEDAGKATAAAIKDAADAAEKAQGTADDAAKAAADAAKAAQDAKDYADEQIKSKVDEATGLIQTALNGKADQSALDAVKNDLAKIGDTYATIATTNELKSSLTALQEQVNKLTTLADDTEMAKELKACKDKVDAFAAGIEALWSAVTSVSLYTSGYSSQDVQGHKDYSIKFLTTVEVADNVFPSETEKVKTGGAQLTPAFKAGKNAVINTDEIVIRVSPANFKLESSMVEIINSQGKPVSKDLIEEIKVEEYNKLLTRGANNGLWKLTFKLKDDYKTDEFKATAQSNKKDVLFAVAVNNTKDNAADRRVVSEYDITLVEGKILHAWDFKVTSNNETKNISEIHNRYYVCERGEKTWTDKDNKVPELTYSNSEAKLKEGKEAYKAVKDRDGFTTYGTANGVDNRQNKPIINAVIGEEIKIAFPYKDDDGYKPIRGFFVTIDYDFAIESAPSEINSWMSYDYDSVGVVRKDANGEYIVKKPAHLFEGNEGAIKINNLGNVKGDVIGFRVYAVNYDGTLYDPDGRAFYVYAGEELDKQTVNVDVTVYDVNVVSKNVSDAVTITDKFLTEATDWTIAWGSNNPEILDATSATATTYAWQTLTAGTWTDIDNLFTFNITPASGSARDASITTTGVITTLTSNPKSIKVTIKQPWRLQNGKTYTLVLTGTKKISTEVGATVETMAEVTLNITKLMPVGLPKDFTVKAGQDVNPLKVYVKPNDYQPRKAVDFTTSIWDVKNRDNDGVFFSYVQDIKPFDLSDIFNGLEPKPTETIVTDRYDKNYVFEFDKSDVSGKNDRSTIATYGWQYLRVDNDGVSTYDLAGLNPVSYSVPYAAPVKVDGTTEHTVTGTYLYKNLSLWKNTNNGNVPVKEDWEQSAEAFKVKYINALNLNRIKESTLQYQWCQAVVNAGVDMTNYPNGKNFDYSKNTDAERKAAEKLMNAYFEISYEDGKTIEFAKSTYWDLQKDDLTLLGVTEAGFAARSGLPVPADWTTTVTANGNNKATTLKDLLDEHCVTIVANSIKVTGGIEQYFNITQVGSSGIKFEPIRSDKKPAITAPIKFTLSFDVQDVFGNKKTLSFNWSNKLQMAVPKGQDNARGL